MRLSEEELDRLVSKPGYRVVGGAAQSPPTLSTIAQETPPGKRRTGTLASAESRTGHSGGVERYRSKAEARYAQWLTTLQHQGWLQQWWFEPMRLWLAPHTTYTPDFLLNYQGSTPPTFVEVKGGFIRDRSLIKLKVAAQLYAPIFRFRLALWRHGAWHEQEVPYV